MYAEVYDALAGGGCLAIFPEVFCVFFVWNFSLCVLVLVCFVCVCMCVRVCVYHYADRAHHTIAAILFHSSRELQL